MTLHLIGTGLGDERDLSLRAVDILKSADAIYFEIYTSINPAPLEAYEEIAGKKITPAPRNLVEEEAEERLILPAKERDIVLLVPGDPLAATTHFGILTRCRELDINIEVLHNASIFTAISQTGLSLYKFGRVVTLPFPQKGTAIDSPYEQLAENSGIGLHTLVLFDLHPQEDRFMEISEAIQLLRESESRQSKGVFTKETILIAAAALGTEQQVIRAGTPSQLEKLEFKAVPRCLIVPGKLSHHEEEALSLWSADEQ